MSRDQSSKLVLWICAGYAFILLIELGVIWLGASHLADKPYDYVSDTAEMIREAAADPTVTYTIHKPAAGCPKGWQLLPGAFHEKDGLTLDACLRNGTGAGDALDVLLPGESFQFTSPLPHESWGAHLRAEPTQSPLQSMDVARVGSARSMIAR